MLRESRFFLSYAPKVGGTVPPLQKVAVRVFPQANTVQCALLIHVGIMLTSSTRNSQLEKGRYIENIAIYRRFRCICIASIRHFEYRLVDSSKIKYWLLCCNIFTRDVNETLRFETETRPRRLTFSSRRDRDRDLNTFHEIETETETSDFWSETRPRLSH